MGVIDFTIADHSLTNGPTGFEEYVSYLVSGLSGNKTQRLYQAMQAEGIPRRGDYHPFLNGLRCVEVSARPDAEDPTIARVTAHWLLPPIEQQTPDESAASGVISIGSSTSSVKTQFDRNGDLMTVKGYVRKPTVQPTTDASGFQIYDYVPETQTGSVDIEVPQTVLALSRRESAAPTQKSLDYVGKVNNSPIWGREARTLLCRRIEGRSDDGGATYMVDYEFQYKPETWDAVVAATEPQTGKPVEYVTDDVPGKATYQVYDLADFDALGISF